MGVAALLAAEVHMGYPGVRAWLPYLLVLPLTAVLLGRMGRHRITLRHGELRVGRAHIPVQALGQIDVIRPEDKRRVLGPQLDPAAFVLHTGWVGALVRITVTDPADPTPYWLFSVRQPETLVASLRDASGGVPKDNSGPRPAGR